MPLPKKKDQKPKKSLKKNTPPEEAITINKSNLNLLVLILFLILVSVAFFSIFRIFLVPIVVAMSLSVLFNGLYKRFLKLSGKRKNLAALVTTFLLIILLLLPLYFLANMVVRQGIEFYNEARLILAQGDGTIMEQIEASHSAQWLDAQGIDWKASARHTLEKVGAWASELGKRTSMGLLETVAMMFITLFTLFYFFRDGDTFIKRIRFLSPLRDKYEEQIIHRFAMISRATVKGTLLIGLLQGIICSITLAVLGIEGWVLWGVIILILSIIPVVGAPIIMVPIAIIQINSGHVWQGIVILVIGTVVNTGLDYLLRPALVGKESKLHDLIIFFSTLGGLAAFGVMGFIIGPVIAMLFVTLLDIYGEEFQPQLAG